MDGISPASTSTSLRPRTCSRMGNTPCSIRPSLELGITVKALLDHVERTRPVRMVYDSLSEMQLLAGSPLRYRRQIRAMKQFFAGRGCTVLLLDDQTAEGSDLTLQSIAHG